MSYTLRETDNDGEHRWAVVHCNCDLADEDDALVESTIQLVRVSYGEEALLEAPQELLPDQILANTFDLQHLTRATRFGLPEEEHVESLDPADVRHVVRQMQGLRT